MKSTPAVLFFVVALVAVVLSGCGGGGGGATPPLGGDTTLPVVSASVIPPTGGWTSAGGNATVRATATDAGGIKSVTARITGPTTSNVTLTNTVGSTYEKTIAVAPNLTSGPVTYTVVVTASDNAGNPASATVTFIVPAAGSDVTPPTLSASVTVPPGWSWLAGDVTVNATAEDVGGIKSVSAVVTPDIGTVTLENTTGSQYQKVVTIPANIEATAVTYTVVVTAKDFAGNSRSVTRTFSVPAIDIPPPPG